MEKGDLVGKYCSKIQSLKKEYNKRLKKFTNLLHENDSKIKELNDQQQKLTKQPRQQSHIKKLIEDCKVKKKDIVTHIYNLNEIIDNMFIQLDVLLYDNITRIDNVVTTMKTLLKQ